MDLRMKKCLSWFLLVCGLATLVVSLIMFWPALRQKRASQIRLDRLNRELDKKTGEYLRLAREIHDLEHFSSAAEKVAREKFKYCKEGELVIYYDLP